MRRLLLFISACILLGMTGCAPKSTNQKAEAPSWKAKHVILIGIDGWGAYSFPKAQIPHIRSLMADGAYTLSKRSVLPSSSAVNWASMYMGAGPELHGYCEWGSQVPDLPSRVVNEHGIFPTIFSELRAAAPAAEIGCIYEWGGIRYLVDTLALSHDKHVTEAAIPRRLPAMPPITSKKKSRCWQTSSLTPSTTPGMPSGTTPRHITPNWKKSTATSVKSSKP